MSPDADALEYIKECASRVEARMAVLVPGQERAPSRIAEAMKYSLFSGGKRLRPAMLMASVEASGSDVDALPEAIDAAAAVEMVHTYSLIHDDLPCMDNDDFRRGIPTSHRVFGEALAVLAGDALLTLAFEVMINAATSLQGDRRERLIRAAGELAWAAGPCGMVGGQVLDIEMGRSQGGSGDPEQMRLLKTGCLFGAATASGGVIGGASEDQVAALRRFGRHFGLGFQIADDIEDESKEAEAGRASWAGFSGVAAARSAALEHLRTARRELEPFGERARALGGIVALIEDRLVEGVGTGQ